MSSHSIKLEAWGPNFHKYPKVAKSPISAEVTTEMVTNNAAAALGVPLAIDLAEKMGLASPHPLDSWHDWYGPFVGLWFICDCFSCLCMDVNPSPSLKKMTVTSSTLRLHKEPSERMIIFAFTCLLGQSRHPRHNYSNYCTYDDRSLPSAEVCLN